MIGRRALASLLLLLSLTSCIAAIGNSGGEARARTPAARAIAREKVAAAEKVVALRQQQIDNLRMLNNSGRADAAALTEAEIQLEEARLRLLDLRAEVAAFGNEGSS
jgi:hypothetical protein